MTQPQPLGPVLHSFFASHLITVRGLRPASVRSYRDTIRLFLVFTAADKGCKITRLTLSVRVRPLLSDGVRPDVTAGMGGVCALSCWSCPAVGGWWPAGLGVRLPR